MFVLKSIATAAVDAPWPLTVTPFIVTKYVSAPAGVPPTVIFVTCFCTLRTARAFDVIDGNVGAAETDTVKTPESLLQVTPC